MAGLLYGLLYAFNASSQSLKLILFVIIALLEIVNLLYLWFSVPYYNKSVDLACLFSHFTLGFVYTIAAVKLMLNAKAESNATIFLLFIIALIVSLYGLFQLRDET